MKRSAAVLLLALAAPLAVAQEKVLRIPIRTDGPKSLDPVQGSTQYEGEVCSQVYDSLVRYRYLQRPTTYEALEPNLLESMPSISADRKTYRFKLKEGVRFQDDPCFPDGKGRELEAKDVLYSWKRIADDDNQPKSWWLLENTILGFDEYRDAQNAAASFDYEAPVEGLRLLGKHEFEVELKEPVHRFLYVLEMFQTAVVPREAVERYGPAFSRHPVGTGPFRMREEDWVVGKSLVLTRNPTYREDLFPTGLGEELLSRRFGESAGKRVPLADRIEITFFVEDQPMWLKFRAGELDFVQTPAENFEEAFVKRTRKLRESFGKEGITSHPTLLLDLIFRGFNMEDPLVGGYTKEKRALRRALHLALDLEEFNDVFYNGTNVVYDGPVPPGLDGYPEGGRLPNGNQGPALDRARALLAEAGYPEGKGLPPLDYWVSIGGNEKEQSELFQRQMAKIGVQVNVHMVDFSQLIEHVNKKRAQVFGFAWGTDYPDAENNLALFYGPNESPGSNHYNYKSAEYDRLYEQVRTMPPSPERTALYGRMRDMVVEDVPYLGSMSRTRYYLAQPWLRNFEPTETFFTWLKYLDVDPAKKAR